MSNKNTLVALFETGDVPSGSDYADLINSNLNLFETAVQTGLGPYNPTELITARVSAGNGNFTGTLAVAGALTAGSFAPSTISVSTMLSARNANVSALVVDNANIRGTTSAATVFVNLLQQQTVNISAAGTTQGTAATVSATICRLRGAADGTATGYILMANRQGWVQQVFNENTVSANLYPCTGGQINALASNAAFGMAASTLYTVVHTRASGYAVG